MSACVFCDIVAGRETCHPIWEDDRHLAFLSIAPNTVGFTVLIPKLHYPSDLAKVPAEVRYGLMDAFAEVSHLLVAAFPDVARVGPMSEGYGVDHVHLKLMPFHGTMRNGVEVPKVSRSSTFYLEYPGFLASNAAQGIPHEDLAELAARIRSFSKTEGE